MNPTFDNHTEPAERLQAALDRAERAENNAADLAAELQAARIALHKIATWNPLAPAHELGGMSTLEVTGIAKAALAKVQPLKTKGSL